VLDSIDQTVWEFFIRNPSLISLARLVTGVGVLPILLPLSAFCGVYLWRRSSSVLVAVTPWIAVQVNSLVVANLKEWTAVVRPPREFWIVSASAGSFPSGHVANTTAFAVVVALLATGFHPAQKKLLWSASGLLCGAMAWSRLALNVHWFSDVVAGCRCESDAEN
jgi:undecaprenyl-diphosphatase